MDKAAVTGQDQFGFDIYSNGWTYRIEDNAIVFHGEAIPSYEEDVDVYYLPLDGIGTPIAAFSMVAATFGSVWASPAEMSATFCRQPLWSPASQVPPPCSASACRVGSISGATTFSVAPASPSSRALRSACGTWSGIRAAGTPGRSE